MKERMADCPSWSRFLSLLCLPLLGSALGAAVVGAGGQERPAATIRVNNYSVSVDVVVTDKHNRYVKDLSIKDFVLTEDGVEQEIQALDSTYAARGVVERTEEEQTTGDAAETAPPIGGTEAENIPPDETNLVILLLDYATIQHSNQVYVRDAAVNFVRQRMRPNDLVAVFRVDTGLKFLQGFTRDKSALQEAVSEQHAQGSVNDFDQSFLTDSAEQAENSAELLSTQIQSIGQAGQASGQAALQAAIIRRQMEKIQALEGLYYSQLSYSREQQSRPIIGAVQSIADGVRHISGRKTLVLFSQGFSVPGTLEPALYAAVESANRSNLAIYSIDAGGLQARYRGIESELHDISANRPGDRVKAYGGLSLFDRAHEVGSDQKESSLRYLANATGGFLVRNTNDLGGALEKIEEEIRGRYLLTYQPSNLHFDGEFRNIEVHVKNRDVKVRARKGYWAVPSGAAALSAEEYRSLIKPSPEPPGEDLTLYAQPAYFLSESGDYDVLLTLEIPASQLQLQSEGDRSFFYMRLFGMIEDSEGAPVISFRGPSRVPIDPESSSQTLHLRFQNSVRLRPGRYALLVHAKDPLNGREALHQGGLSLPEIDSSEAALSSLVLARGMVAQTDSGDLTIDGFQILPSATRHFLYGERLLFFLNLYRPGTERNSPKLDMKISLFRAGQPVSDFSEEISAGVLDPLPVPHLKVARYVELEGLQEGRYEIRAEFHDRVRNQTLKTQTSFDIGPTGPQ